MSNWIEIKDKADIKCSMSRKTIDVWIGSDDFGSNYISIPKKIMLDVLTEAGYTIEKPRIETGGDNR